MAGTVRLTLEQLDELGPIAAAMLKGSERPWEQLYQAATPARPGNKSTV
jgi:hypothetical protein